MKKRVVAVLFIAAILTMAFGWWQRQVYLRPGEKVNVVCARDWTIFTYADLDGHAWHQCVLPDPGSGQGSWQWNWGQRYVVLRPWQAVDVYCKGQLIVDYYSLAWAEDTCLAW